MSLVMQKPLRYLNYSQNEESIAQVDVFLA